MSAYFESGFSVRVPMWHGLGDVLDDYPVDWADARQKAGLLWEPKLITPYQRLTVPEPVLDPLCNTCMSEDVRLVAEDATMRCNACGMAWLAPLREYREVDNHRLVVRDDTEHVLGMVSDQYRLIHHADMGEIIEALLTADSALKFETAGSLKEGAVVWALAYLDEPFKVGRDDSESLPFLALLNAHDGTGSCRVIFTRVRIVCWNTYQAADADARNHGTAYTFRHTGNVAERIEEAKAAVARLRDGVGEWSEEADELIALNIDDPRVEWFLSEFIPMPAATVIVSDRVKGNIEKARTLYRNFYYDSVTTDAHRGTALGLIDAATEYLDHARSYRNSDSRIGRSLLRAEPMKIKATSIARRAAAATL